MSGNGRVLVGFCYGQSTITPQWRKCYTHVTLRDAATKRRIVGELAHEASGAHVPTARTSIVREFLDHPAKPEWLWLVDTDATFADDVLERLLAVADPKERPIVGALAFGVRPFKDAAGNDLFNDVYATPLQLFPTIYVMDPDTTDMVCVYGYPQNEVVRCHATGAHCMVIHRSVLADQRWLEDGHPLPWFRMAVRNGREVSEDQFFCLRAGALGFPIHVDTSVKTGHVKTFVADEDFYLAQNDATPEPAPPVDVPVDVIVPVLHRPQNIAPLMESLKATAPSATAWFVCEPDDLIVWAEVERCGGRVLVHPGSFASKVNYAYGKTDAEWMLLVGDDVVFHPGWLDEAITAAGSACVVGTNDLGNPRVMRGEHATHPMIRRDYVAQSGASFDGPGVVCHEGYRHCFVDDEIVLKAKHDGVWTSAVRSIVEHRHPYWGKSKTDDVYKLGESFLKGDKALFERRMRRYLKAAS